MLRIAKLTDYAIVVLVHLAREPQAPKTAREVAGTCGIPLPTVSKVLKALSRAGLVVSLRGVHGGCRLSKPPSAISIAQAVEAMEGSLSLTECASECAGGCSLETVCPVRDHWRAMNDVVRNALATTSLLDFVRAPRTSLPLLSQGLADGSAEPGTARRKKTPRVPD